MGKARVVLRHLSDQSDLSDRSDWSDYLLALLISPR